VTDGMSDARYASFDKNGEYLYFTASTDVGPSAGWIDLSSIDRPVSRSVYVTVLNKDLPSPLAPESDEENSTQRRAKIAPQGAGKESRRREEQEDKGGPSGRTGPVESISRTSANGSWRFPFRRRITKGSSPGRQTRSTCSRPYGGKASPTALPKSTSLSPGSISPIRKTETVLEGWSRSRFPTTARRCCTARAVNGLSPAATRPPNRKERAQTGRARVYVDPAPNEADGTTRSGGSNATFSTIPDCMDSILKKPRRYMRPIWRISRAARSQLSLRRDARRALHRPHVRRRRRPAGSKEVKGGLLGADYKIENGRYRFDRAVQWGELEPAAPRAAHSARRQRRRRRISLAVQGRELRAADISTPFSRAPQIARRDQSGPQTDGAGGTRSDVVPVATEAASHLA